ncbi:MAG: DNA repair protein RecO [Mogibacterium sp.]|nr:DNA repair protein RecO [Mogibacterium sp.]
MIVSAEGIVLRQRKIANNRRMIVIFTRQYGKLSAGTSINERSKSKAALALRPFTHAEYDIFKGREAYSINSASVLHSYYSIGEDINRYMTAAAFLEYLEKVLDEGVAMPALFKLSLEFLDSVAVAKSSAETLLFAFIVKSLRMLGVMPELECCVNCGRALADIQAPRMLSVSSGGIVCPECAEVENQGGASLIYKPSFDIINVLRYFESKPLKAFEKIDMKKEDANAAREILANYTERYLDVNVLGKPYGEG